MKLNKIVFALLYISILPLYGFAFESIFFSDETEKWSVSFLIKIGILCGITLIIHFAFLIRRLNQTKNSQILKTTHASLLMQTNVTTTSPEYTLADTQQIMLRHKIRHLPVVSESNELIGIITQKDIIRYITKTEKLDVVIHDSKLLQTCNTQELMTKKIVTAKTYDTLTDIIALVSTNEIGIIPIVNQQNKLEGIITQTDIIKILHAILP
jgi:CBS-domain-containing membrane protein